MKRPTSTDIEEMKAFATDHLVQPECGPNYHCHCHDEENGVTFCTSDMTSCEHCKPPTVKAECSCKLVDFGLWKKNGHLDNCSLKSDQRAEWEDRFDQEFPYDTFVSAHQDWTYDSVKKFIAKELAESKAELLILIQEKILEGEDTEHTVIRFNQVREYVHKLKQSLHTKEEK